MRREPPPPNWVAGAAAVVARLASGLCAVLLQRLSSTACGRCSPTRCPCALLSQLFLNLAALRIERLETLVAAEDLDLLGFLQGAGFSPGQRLAFVNYGDK